MFDTKSTVGRWPSILSAIGVDEKTLSKRNCPCPFCGGKDRFRFTDHEQVGTWVCNVCGSGNGFHFVQKWENVDFKGACKIVEKILPQASVTPPPKKVDNRKRLNGVWKQTTRVGDGDVVSKYLRKRGVWIAPGEDIRTHPGLKYFEDGKVIGTHPAMIALVRDAKHKPVTLHVTYLDHDGNKADVGSQKKVLSSLGEGSHVVIRPAKLGVNSYTLCVTEGIETALAVCKYYGGHGPTWAMLSAQGLEKLVVPDGLERLEVWGDNDAKFRGQASSYLIAHRVAVTGVHTVVKIPTNIGEDWADEACRRENPAV